MRVYLKEGYPQPRGSGRRKEKKMEVTCTATVTGEGAFPSAADVRDFVEGLDDHVEVRFSRGGGQLDPESWVLTATWTEVG